MKADDRQITIMVIVLTFWTILFIVFGMKMIATNGNYTDVEVKELPAGRD